MTLRRSTAWGFASSPHGRTRPYSTSGQLLIYTSGLRLLTNLINCAAIWHCASLSDSCARRPTSGPKELGTLRRRLRCGGWQRMNLGRFSSHKMHVWNLLTSPALLLRLRAYRTSKEFGESEATRFESVSTRFEDRVQASLSDPWQPCGPANSTGDRCCACGGESTPPSSGPGPRDSHLDVGVRKDGKA